MQHTSWIWFGLIILLAWGIVGLLQKLSTMYLSAEAALVWWVVGLILVEPLMYQGSSVFHYSGRAISWGLLAGFLNTLGSWGLLASMKSGGKASIVVTLTALYPVIVIPLVPVLFHESITLKQGLGIACAVGAVILLAGPTAHGETLVRIDER